MIRSFKPGAPTNNPKDRSGLISFCGYGPSKSGKTWFIGTWPKVAILTASSERGGQSLRFHPNAENITVFEVGDEGRGQDTVEYEATLALQEIYERAHKGEFLTVAVDTGTVLVDQIHSKLCDYGEQDMWGKGTDNKWIKLQQKILNIRNFLTSMPCHIIWTFHDYQKKGDNFLSPSLPGKTYRTHLAPTFEVIAYFEQWTRATGEIDQMGLAKTKTDYVMWLRCPTDRPIKFETGLKNADRLPDVGYIDANFGLLQRAFNLRGE